MTKDNVIIFPKTLEPLPIPSILEAAQNADLETIIVIGECKNGSMLTACSIPNAGAMLWLMEVFKRRIFEVVDEWERDDGDA